MNDQITFHDVEGALGALETAAPETLHDRVLAAVGLVDRMAVIAGPLGPLNIVFNERGVSGCAPTERWDRYLERHPATVVEVDELPPELHAQIRHALETGRLGRLPVDLERLTTFQASVLRKTAEIPPGEVRPYGWVAREIGKPGALRAVGSALNKNPVPILIPCHRVNRSDGHLGNYAYGPEMKRSLLAHEGLEPDEVEALADRGIRFLGTRGGGAYCHPTCRHAKRILPQNLVEFRSAAAAHAAGYRPCSACRPAA